MKQFWKSIDIYVKIGFITSLILLVASFCVPPTGIIDASVLKAVAEIDGFTSIICFLYKLPEYLSKGAVAKIQRGDTTIEVTGEKNNDGE